jgi:hypothetical protein
MVQEMVVIRCRGALLFGLLLAAGCSRSGGSSPPETRFTVVATTPVSGANEVEPTTVIGLTLATPSQALTAADLIVTDGSNRLPGTIARVGSSAQWNWTPVGELPRNATVTVATPWQGIVTVFTVRPGVASASLELPMEEVDNAMSWPSGRSALRTRSGRVFELLASTSELVERFCTMPRWSVRAIGDGRFVGSEDELGVRYCVRGSLAGDYDRVPIPLAQSIGDVNAAGDVVVLVPGYFGTPAEQGLWRLRHDAVGFELVAPLSVPYANRPSIEADGTVAVAWTENGIVHLARFVPGDLAGQRYTLDVGSTMQSMVVDVRYDASDDGRGVMAFVVRVVDPAGQLPVRLVVRAARFAPGSGLQLLPQELRSWTGPSPSPGPDMRDLTVGELGSAAVELRHFFTPVGAVQTTGYHEVVRVEVDDSISAPFEVARTTFPAVPTYPAPHGQNPVGKVATSPGRAEVWGLSTPPVSTAVTLNLSRPYGTASIPIYSFASGHAYGDWYFTFDDSGRGFYAVVEAGPMFNGTRIVVIE